MKKRITIGVAIVLALGVIGSFLPDTAEVPVAVETTTTTAAPTTTTTLPPTTTTVPQGPDHVALAEATCTAFETLFLFDMLDIYTDVLNTSEYESLQFVVAAIVTTCPEQIEQLAFEIKEFYPQYVDRLLDEIAEIAAEEGVTA